MCVWVCGNLRVIEIPDILKWLIPWTVYYFSIEFMDKYMYSSFSSSNWGLFNLVFVYLYSLRVNLIKRTTLIIKAGKFRSTNNLS